MAEKARNLEEDDQGSEEESSGESEGESSELSEESSDECEDEWWKVLLWFYLHVTITVNHGNIKKRAAF